MAIAFKTPGVTIEEIARLPPIVSAVATAVPAFIGYTEKQVDLPDNNIARITSLAEYEWHFGGPRKEKDVTVTASSDGKGEIRYKAELDPSKRSQYIMYYAMQMFYANGGGPCYVVSADLYAADDKVQDAKLSDGLTRLAKIDEPTLIVFPEALWLKIDAYKTLMDAALKQCADLQDRFLILDMHGGDGYFEHDSEMSLGNIVEKFRDAGIGQENLKYGAAYVPNLETVLDLAVDETTTKVTYPKDGGGEETGMLQDLIKTHNLVYASARAAIRDLACTMPPSPAIAGIYAAVDGERGVWKAPANVGVAAVIQPRLTISDADQAIFNDDSKTGKSVNVVRAFTGMGTMVWGARTLAGNDAEWRYINVRRLFIMVEESCKNACRQFVFEPNDANTWVRLQGMLENFLSVLWRQGALQGAKPEHAFYVSIGLNKTMTPQDLLNGILRVEVGLAAVRPAEFIVLSFSHKLAQS